MPTPLTPGILQSFFLGLDLTFNEAIKLQETVWQKIAMLKTSVHEQEVYAWLDLIPSLRKWAGPRVINQLSTRAQSLKNELFEDTIGVRRAKLEDDTAGIYSDYIRQLGMASALWPEQLVIAALKAGASSVVYDNQYFFDTDHPVNLDDPSSAVQANDFDYSVNGANGGAAGFTADNIADAYAKGRQLKAGNGEPYDVNYNIMLVPPQLTYAANKLMNGTLIAQPVGANAAAAIDNQIKGLMEPVTSARLSDQPGYIYLLDCRMPVKPFLFQERNSPEFTPRFDPADPHVFNNDEFLAGVRARGAAGYGPWWLAARVKVA